MIRQLSDILVLSDVDGTLLASDKTLPRGNLETINLFTTLGGRFAVATGRVAPAMHLYKELLGSLSLSITCGGCVIYDYFHNHAIENYCLPRAVSRRAIADIMRAFPQLGVVVMGSNGKVYHVVTSEQTHGLYMDERVPVSYRPIDTLPDEWNKVLFASTPDVLQEVEDFVSKKVYPGVYFVASDTVYFEMLPQGVNKGSAVSKLCRLLDVPIENTIVIGDYYNDIDMMRVAGHAVAMGNAPREIRILADEVTGSNDDCGVGQYLYKLIKKYG